MPVPVHNSPSGPQPINKLPFGLLGFFGIKNGGEYPQYLQNTIQGGFDLRELLQANYFENLVVPVAGGTVGWATANFLNGSLAGQPAVVPAGEIWYVSSIGVFAALGAGDSATWACAWRERQTGSASLWYRPMTAEFSAVANTTRLLSDARSTQTGFVPPAAEFGIWSSANVNASGTALYSLQLKVTRYLI